MTNENCEPDVRKKVCLDMNDVPVRRGAKVKHCRDADQDSGRGGVHIQPERDERTSHEDHSGYENSAEVKRLVPREHQVNREAAELSAPRVARTTYACRVLDQVRIQRLH